MRQLVEDARRRFRERHGREPGPDDVLDPRGERPFTMEELAEWEGLRRELEPPHQGPDGP